MQYQSDYKNRIHNCHRYHMLYSEFWVCFAMWIIYYSVTNPGKNIQISSYIGKRFIITYLPSIAVSLLLILLVQFNDTTDNIEQCWRSVSDGSSLQYVIYIFSYIVPTVICIGVLILLIVLYYKSKPENQKFNWFLLFPFG